MKIDWGLLFMRFFVLLCFLGTGAAFIGYLYSLFHWPKITWSLTLFLFVYVLIEDWIKEHLYKKRKK